MALVACVILKFSTHELKGGQPSACTFCFYCHGFVMCAAYGFAVSFCKRCGPEGAICWFKSLVYFYVIMLHHRCVHLFQKRSVLLIHLSTIHVSPEPREVTPYG